MKNTYSLRKAVSLFAVLVVLAGTPVVSAKSAYIFDVTDKVETPHLEDESVWQPTAVAVSEQALSVGGKSAVLMEQQSGEVLYDKNPHEKLPIASVTKIMTLLLTMEAIDGELIRIDDTVTCSATAASMGGSQIWLEQGEQMTVEELLKAATVVSANDACAALAEHICGTIENFVLRMNERAAELGMKNTQFLDCSGLNDEAYSSAHDVALMARELMKHTDIQKYTTIWMDTLRDGKSQLVNTNKLVRHYKGATGLKTGTTAAAGHCLAATATRDGMSFVAVVLGCETTDERFGGARAMLDYGFANFSLYTPQPEADAIQPIKVIGGVEREVAAQMDSVSPLLLKKGQEKNIVPSLELAADVQAPVEKGQILGTYTLLLDNKVVAQIPVRATADVQKMSLFCALGKLWRSLVS